MAGTTTSLSTLSTSNRCRAASGRCLSIFSSGECCTSSILAAVCCQWYETTDSHAKLCAVAAVVAAAASWQCVASRSFGSDTQLLYRESVVDEPHSVPASSTCAFQFFSDTRWLFVSWPRLHRGLAKKKSGDRSSRPRVFLQKKNMRPRCGPPISLFFFLVRCGSLFGEPKRQKQEKNHFRSLGAEDRNR